MIVFIGLPAVDTLWHRSLRRNTSAVDAMRSSKRNVIGRNEAIWLLNLMLLIIASSFKIKTSPRRQERSPEFHAPYNSRDVSYLDMTALNLIIIRELVNK